MVLLACISLGMHWAVLQSVAWTGMLITRLQSEGVLEAVEKTFDGEHPCPMCLALKKAQKDERKNSAPTGAKLKFHLVADLTPRVVIPAMPRSVGHVTTLPLVGVRPHAPQVPPPRHLTA